MNDHTSRQPPLFTPNGDGSPGTRIRALRLGQGLTLAQLSARIGLAISTLSKLEKGSISLSYDKLLLISQGLGLDMASLVDPKPQLPRIPGLTAGRRVLQRAGEGQVVETSSYRQTYLATELLNKKMTPIFVEIRARTLAEFVAEFGGLIRHPGEEFSYVLEGELDFHSELYAPVRLRTGDSIYFDSEMGHAYLNATQARCRLLCNCSPRGPDDEVDAHVFINIAGIRHSVEPLTPGAFTLGTSTGRNMSTTAKSARRRAVD
jgi:transcriptional regulator with XRE-family HTH domain